MEVLFLILGVYWNVLDCIGLCLVPKFHYFQIFTEKIFQKISGKNSRVFHKMWKSREKNVEN